MGCERTADWGTTKSPIPSSPLVCPTRAATTISSARTPSKTKCFSPWRTQLSPSGTAVVVTSAAVPRARCLGHGHRSHQAFGATAPRKRLRWASEPAATQSGDELSGRGQEGRR